MHDTVQPNPANAPAPQVEPAVGASVGVAVAPFDSNDAEGLLRCADLALYRAKSEGRGTVRYFEPEMDAAVVRRRGLEADLREAVATEALALHCRPQVSLDTGTVTGFEALLRWQHPVRGPVSPAEVIPLAEETGLIGPIGRWVLREACRAALAWPPGVRVAVNVSTSTPTRARRPSCAPSPTWVTRSA